MKEQSDEDNVGTSLYRTIYGLSEMQNFIQICYKQQEYDSYDIWLFRTIEEMVELTVESDIRRGNVEKHELLELWLEFNDVVFSAAMSQVTNYVDIGAAFSNNLLKMAAKFIRKNDEHFKEVNDPIMRDYLLTMLQACKGFVLVGRFDIPDQGVSFVEATNKEKAKQIYTDYFPYRTDIIESTQLGSNVLRKSMFQ